MARRVTIGTAGHLSTCPRMLKAADALHDAGFIVRVVSVRYTPWAAEADERVASARTWTWDVVDAARTSAPARWLVNGARHRAARALATGLGDAAPDVVAIHGISRVHDALVSALMREPADLLYGGTTGALAAIAEAGRCSGTPFGIDFEDFHCGEHVDDGQGRSRNALAARVMRDVLRDAAFVTAGSAAIGEAVRQRFGAAPIAINNVFPLPGRTPRFDAPLDRRLYWFGQAIGPGRGLEDVVRAIGLLDAACDLHLRGATGNGYVDGLRRFAAATAPKLAIHVHTPGDPSAMVDACRPYAVGIAAETGVPLNSALCLTNKALTYPLAGLPVLMTDTPGQRGLAADLGEGACVCPPGDSQAMADGLSRWFRDAQALARARDASWAAARRRWHWEHDDERGALLRCIERALR